LTAGLSSAHAYYHCDGNGNVTALVDTNGVILARYTYDPYGNILSMSGPLATANLYRFSSKEWHASSGLNYYGYRFYDPNLQRWLNRDLLEEDGGINLYGAMFNDPVNLVDADGQFIPILLAVVGLYFASEMYANAPARGDEGLSGLTDNPLGLIGPGDCGEGLAVLGKDAAESLGEAATKSVAMTERARNIEKGIPAKDLGPSGKPKRHFVEHPTRKRAQDAARTDAGKGGTTVEHSNPREGDPHFHGQTQSGEKCRTHHEYPK